MLPLTGETLPKRARGENTRTQFVHVHDLYRSIGSRFPDFKILVYHDIKLDGVISIPAEELQDPVRVWRINLGDERS